MMLHAKKVLEHRSRGKADRKIWTSNNSDSWQIQEFDSLFSIPATLVMVTLLYDFSYLNALFFVVAWW